MKLKSDYGSVKIEADSLLEVKELRELSEFIKKLINESKEKYGKDVDYVTLDLDNFCINITLREKALTEKIQKAIEPFKKLVSLLSLKL